jgi:hypothetical protein
VWRFIALSSLLPITGCESFLNTLLDIDPYLIEATWLFLCNLKAMNQDTISNVRLAPLDHQSGDWTQELSR